MEAIILDSMTQYDSWCREHSIYTPAAVKNSNMLHLELSIYAQRWGTALVRFCEAYEKVHPIIQGWLEYMNNLGKRGIFEEYVSGESGYMWCISNTKWGEWYILLELRGEQINFNSAWQ